MIVPCPVLVSGWGAILENYVMAENLCNGKGKTDERIEKNKDHMDYIKTLAIQE